MLLSLRRRVRFHHKLFRSLALLQRFSLQNLEKSFRECFNSQYEMNDSLFRALKFGFLCFSYGILPCAVVFYNTKAMSAPTTRNVAFAKAPGTFSS